MPPRKEIAPELLAEARRLYEQTVTPVDDIWALMGVSRSTFYSRARQGNWVQRRYSSSEAFDAVPQAEEEVPPQPEEEAAPVTPEREAILRARLFRAAEKEMDAIERILRLMQPGNQAQSERSARIVASLNRSLREIAEITKAERTPPTDAADPDSLPRDLDELRRELARRVNAFVDSRTAAQNSGREGSDGGVAEA